jgi:hypothetical protein
MMAPFASEATANRLRHSLTEKRFRVSMSSPDTPMTVAPKAAYCGVASAKLLASMVHPLVNALG